MKLKVPICAKITPNKYLVNVSIESLNNEAMYTCSFQQSLKTGECMPLLYSAYYYQRYRTLTTDLFVRFNAALSRTLNPQAAILQYFVQPFFYFILAPLAILLNVFNMFLLREVLKEGSTLVYHRVECIVDIILIVAYWLSYIDNHLGVINCFLESIPIYSTYIYEPLYSYGLIDRRFYFATLFNLLPIITNTLLAVDRYRSVRYPLEWKSTYGQAKYAKKLIVKVFLAALPIILLLNAATFTLSYFSAKVSTDPGTFFQVYCGQYYPCSIFLDYLTNVCVSLILVVVITFSLALFIYHLRATGGGSTAEKKRVRNATNLVIGTLIPQYIVTILSTPANLNYSIMFLSNTALGYNLVGSFRILPPLGKSTISDFFSNFLGYYDMSVMLSSAITVFVHMLTCSAYRRGAKKFILKVFCCKKYANINSVHPTGASRATTKT
jgi:hypothetical protein